MGQEAQVRFDELVLTSPDGELRLRFNPRLTVLSGFAPDERRQLVEGILGALEGRPGCALRAEAGGAVGPVATDGAEVVLRPASPGAPGVPLAPLATLRANVDTGVPRLVVRAARPDDPPELVEARAALAALDAELDAAQAAAAERERLERALEEVTAQLRQAVRDEARRAYARTLADLDRVRAESASLAAGADGERTDEALLAGAESVLVAERIWNEQANRLEQLRRDLGDAERLDPEEARRAATVPAGPPEGLDGVLDALAAAVAHHDALEARLQDLSVARLPEPSDPLVVELAHLDQERLWSTLDRSVTCAAELEAARLELGGIGGTEPGEATGGTVADLESAHDAVDRAEAAAEAIRPRVLQGCTAAIVVTAVGLLVAPLLALVALVVAAGIATAGLARPALAVRRARQAEAAALEGAGVTSYLGFHLRRVEATIEPARRSRLELATGQARLARQAWVDLVGEDVGIERVRGLETEVRAYRHALGQLGDTAGQIQHLRAELAGAAVPALSAARAALAEQCETYGVDPAALADDDPTLLRRLFDHQVRLGRQARAQLVVEEVERAEADAASTLDRLLDAAQVVRTDRLERLRRWREQVQAAGARADARRRARDPRVVAADLDRLEAEAARLHRPEWSDVTPDDGPEPDLAALGARRAQLEAEVRAAGRGDHDPARLADRRAAVERRILALESRHGGDDPTPDRTTEVAQRLDTLLAAARQAGADGGPVPIVLDDPLGEVPAERKWDLLDQLARRAGDQQVVYLCDDAFVAAWARSRVDPAALTLFEPEPA